MKGNEGSSYLLVIVVLLLLTLQISLILSISTNERMQASAYSSNSFKYNLAVSGAEKAVDTINKIIMTNEFESIEEANTKFASVAPTKMLLDDYNSYTFSYTINSGILVTVNIVYNAGQYLITSSVTQSESELKVKAVAVFNNNKIVLKNVKKYEVTSEKFISKNVFARHKEFTNQKTKAIKY